MPVLGVLTCEILELEIAYLLKKDTRVSHIFVIHTAGSQGFIKALKTNGIEHFTLLPSTDDFRPAETHGLLILVHVLELGMHSRKSKLQDALVTESRNLGLHSDALFLGYGLCGNALKDPDALFSHLNIPFFLPQDSDHPADDCVGLFIGGREAYYAEQIKEAGTFFMTPGWTNHWKAMIENDSGNMTLQMARRMFKDYKRTLLVSTPVMEPHQMKENILEFNRLFDCCSEISQGSLTLLNTAWQAACSHALKKTPMKKQCCSRTDKNTHP